MANRQAERPAGPAAAKRRRRSARPANPRRPGRPSQRTSAPGKAETAHERRWPLVLALVAAVTLIATAAGAFYLTRGAREVSVDAAVEDFRSVPGAEVAEATVAPSSTPAAADVASNETASTKTAATGAARQPVARPPTNAFRPVDDGVYVYATKGYEQTDALAGQRHEYPSETTMTIRKGGCGWMSRWQPFSERWEESEFCETPQGSRTVRYTMYHEFFRRGQKDDFKCDGYVHKKGDKPGDSWTFTCQNADSKATSKVTVVGFETLDVGGAPVRTIRIRYDITTTGANRGKLLQERWLTDEPRRMVRLVQKADLVTQSPFGPVGYEESFRIDLKSMTPRR